MKNPLHSFIAIYIYVGARLYKCTISSVLKKESPSIEEVVCGNITSISTSKQVNKHSFFHILALTWHNTFASSRIKFSGWLTSQKLVVETHAK